MSEQNAIFSTVGSLDNVVHGLNLSSAITEANLEISTIPSAWLLNGQAQTRSKLLGKTQDHLAYVMLWECGAASFKWHYSKDELLIVLSGDAFIADENGRERHIGPSEVAFFPAGSNATWRIPNHVRKIAILKSPVNRPMVFILKVWIKLLEMAGLSGDSGL